MVRTAMVEGRGDSRKNALADARRGMPYNAERVRKHTGKDSDGTYYAILRYELPASTDESAPTSSSPKPAGPPIGTTYRRRNDDLQFL